MNNANEVVSTPTMKRDPTVWGSLLLLLGAWITALALGMPRTIRSDDPIAFRVLSWIMFLAAIRVTVLWFQTLIHGVKYAKEENRVAVVLGHVFLGPLMSYLYYYDSTRKRAAPEEPKA